MELSDRYRMVRNRTEVICKPLITEDFVIQPAEFVSPPKWHLGHTTWFFEKLILQKFISGYKQYHSSYDYFFNSYYESLGPRVSQPDRGYFSRPSVEDVLRYRKHVDEHMDLYLSEQISEEAEILFSLGIQHEQQHQELLLMDIKYIFGFNPMYPVYSSDSAFESEEIKEKNIFIQIDGGMYTIGHCTDDFCFDNEKPAHQTYVAPFRISKTLVTNHEYLEFIEDGGYGDFRWWLDEGWRWLKENQISAPLYWRKSDGEWMHYTLAGEKPVSMKEALCHISYYEAAAFANWKQKRLPTEFEWEIAARKFEWGSRWEWTSSAYLPYPNFKPNEGPTGEYNGKFMVNQMVLRGASIATPPDHRRITYRNFFHPHRQWQYSGIRLAE
jgi:ergothioneine biosynthesis protein EgtB